MHSVSIEVVEGIDGTFVTQRRGRETCRAVFDRVTEGKKTYDVIDFWWRVWAAATIGNRRSFACSMQLASRGAIASSGFTITPSARMTRLRFARSNSPSAEAHELVALAAVNGDRRSSKS